MTKTSSTTAGKVAGALGLTAGVVAALAAGYYFYGKNGKEHRKEVSDWSKKAKKEMLEKIKKMKTVTKAAYYKAADEVLEKYKQLKNVNSADIQAFGQELKTHWEQISKEASKLGNKSEVKQLEQKDKI